MADTNKPPWPDPDPFPVRPEWLALGAEAALEPDLPIVDPHHHLWHRQARYMLDEFLADLDTGHRIVSTVFVQAHAMYRVDGPERLRSLGETEFVNGIAAIGASGRYGPTRLCEGIVGAFDLREGPAVADLCEAHLCAAGARFKGVRTNWQWDDDPALPNAVGGREAFRDPDFRSGLAVIARYGLSFDTWLYFPQLPEIAAVADACPELPIALNHCGGVVGVGRYANRRQEVFQTWRDLMSDAARRPNIVVKFGGFGMPFCGFGYRDRPAPPTSAELATDWAPYLETCLELFGAERVMFESNFPADKTSFGYATAWNAFKRLAQPLTAAEKQALFSGTARRFYRLGERGRSA